MRFDKFFHLAQIRRHHFKPQRQAFQVLELVRNLRHLLYGLHDGVSEFHRQGGFQNNHGLTRVHVLEGDFQAIGCVRVDHLTVG